MRCGKWDSHHERAKSPEQKGRVTDKEARTDVLRELDGVFFMLESSWKGFIRAVTRSDLHFAKKG